jgi:hypothetical protein
MRRDLEDAATHLGIAHELRFHPMFGGLMAYLYEKPCAWLGDGGLALKLAPADQPELLALDDVARFIPPGVAKASRQYLILPPALTSDTPAFAIWLEKSLRAAQKRPARKRRP